MWILKISLILTFLIIFKQDCKDRMVYWFLYPVVGLLAFLIQYNENNLLIAITNSSFNILFVLLLLLICFVYSKLKLKKSFVNEVIGDILFFVFITFSFSIISFIVLFVFSMLFSLLLHFVLKNSNKDMTIPLAGYMSLFFAVIYTMSFFYNCSFLFAY